MISKTILYKEIDNLKIVNLPTKNIMLGANEVKLISFISEKYFRGNGKIIDAGCGSGGSTLAILDGLIKNKNILSTSGILHCYDKFLFDHKNYKLFFPNDDLEMNETFIHLFYRNLGNLKSMVTAHSGDLIDQIWNPNIDVEILFIDLMKTKALASKCIQIFFPSLSPGSIIIHQDFERPHLYWIHLSCAHLKDYLTPISELIDCTLVYQVNDNIPVEVICQSASLIPTLDDVALLIDYFDDDLIELCSNDRIDMSKHLLITELSMLLDCVITDDERIDTILVTILNDGYFRKKSLNWIVNMLVKNNIERKKALINH